MCFTLLRKYVPKSKNVNIVKNIYNTNANTSSGDAYTTVVSHKLCFTLLHKFVPNSKNVNIVTTKNSIVTFKYYSMMHRCMYPYEMIFHESNCFYH